MSALDRLAARVPRRWLSAVARLQWRHPLLKRGYDAAVRLLRERDRTLAHGVGRGLRFNAGNANLGYALGTSEPAVQAAFALLVEPGMTVFDVGANVGFHAMLAARLVGPAGRVICFEPVADNAARIRHNARLNGFRHVYAREEALADRDGSARFTVSANSTWGRLAEVGAPDQAAGEIDVPLRTADAVVRELGAPDLIKIDVEGAEAAVLAGAAGLLREQRPRLLIELHGTNAPVAAALEQAGYHALVLGSSDSPAASRWDAHLVAWPAERPLDAERVARLTDPALGA